MTTAEPPGPCLYAIYDLGRLPVTFDVMNFFAFAHLYATRAEFGGYHVVFVLGDGDGFRSRTLKDKTLSRDDKIWRLWHLLMPHAGVARKCRGVSFLQDRAELAQLMKALHPRQIFPPGYSVDEPKLAILLKELFPYALTADEMNVFAPSASAVERAAAWLHRRIPGGRPVTFTLRMSRVEPERNSHLDEWLAAGRAIRKRGFAPVIVPDTDVVSDGRDLSIFEDFPVYSAAAVNLDLRIAMYHLAALNMADNGGPAFLPYFMAGATMLCFLPVDRISPTLKGSLEYMADQMGIEVGGSFPHATPLRRLVWRPDRRDAIVEEFEKAAGTLSASVANCGPGPG